MALRILGYILEILPRLKSTQQLYFLNQAALAALLLCQNMDIVAFRTASSD